jgi:exonuclease SbcD
LVRVAHISDTHLGYTRYARLSPETNRNQREVDVAAAYTRVVDEILEREVNLVVHSGDVFDSIRPATHVIIHFLKQTSRITRERIPYLGIAGNHETPRLRTTTAALEYANLVRAYFACSFVPEYESVDIGDTRVGVTLVPHGAVADREVVVSPDPEADINIMVTHGTVPGLLVQGHELGEVDLPNRVLEGDFDYVALGHYHYFHEHKENAYYSGATERFSFSEVDSEPGFAILEFSDGNVEIEHVPLEARPMIDLPRINAAGMTGADLTDTVRERAEAADLLDGAIVRQKVVDAPRGLVGEMDRALLRDLKRRCLSYSLEVTEAGMPEVVGTGAETSFGSLEEEFKAFVGARREKGDLTSTFAEEFLEKGLSYLRAAGSGERP